MKLLMSYVFALLPFFIFSQIKEKGEVQRLQKTSYLVKLVTYEELANEYFSKTGKGDSVIYYGDKIVALSKKMDNEAHEVKGLSLLGKGYAANRELEKAEISLKRGVMLAFKNKSISSLAEVNNRLAGVYQNMDKMPLSIEHNLEAIKYAQQSENYKVEALSYYGISIIYSLQDQKGKQLNYLSKAIKLCDEKEKLPPLIKCLVYGSASQQYSAIADEFKEEIYKDSSLIYAKKSLEVSRENELKQRIPADLVVLGYYYVNNGGVDEGQKYLEEALSYVKYARGATQLNIYQILTHIHKGKDEKANSYKYLDSLNELSIKKRPQYGAMISKLSHSVYKYFNDYDLAFKSLDEYFEFEKEKKQIEQNKTINELETRYQTELKDAKIERLTFYLIASLVVLLATFLLFYVFRLRKSKEKNKALRGAISQQLALEKELVNVRNNIAQDFHDDLGNKLARISFLTHLVEDELSDGDVKLKAKVTQVKEDTISLYVGTKDFIFSLKPNSDYLEEVVTYLSDFGEDYFSDTKIQFVIDKNINLNKKLPHYWSKQLIFIFKEAMTNAFKHANCNKLILHFKQKEDVLVISCIDNGKGVSEEEMSSKNGLSNMKKRAKKINGDLDVVTSREGTVIRFTGSLTN